MAHIDLIVWRYGGEDVVLPRFLWLCMFFITFCGGLVRRVWTVLNTEAWCSVFGVHGLKRSYVISIYLSMHKVKTFLGDGTLLCGGSSCSFVG